MFKSFEPNKIFVITSKAPKYVLCLFIVVLTIGLMEIAIENNICDYNIIEPYMTIFLLILENYRFEKNFVSIIKKIE